MEKKYSTGTKGRIRMHGDKCREFIHAHSPNFSLATEFIETIDPGHDDTVWQKYQNPSDILSELEIWLGGGSPVPAQEAAVPTASIPSASQLLSKPEDVVLQQTLAWLRSPSGQSSIAGLTPQEAAEAAIKKFHKDLLRKAGDKICG